MLPIVVFVPPYTTDWTALGTWAQVIVVAIGLYYAFQSAESARASAELARKAIEDSNAQARRTALFDHLRVIDERSNALFGVPALSFVLKHEAAPTEGSTFSAHFRLYMSVLNALDLLSFAVERGEVDFEVVAVFLADMRHLRGWLADMTTRMRELQPGNEHLWDHARHLLTRLDDRARATPPST